MCFPFSFGGSGSRKRKSASAPAEKKRRESRPHSDVLRGNGAVVAEVSEKRRPSSERQKKTRSRESPRREREEVRYAGQQYHHQPQQYTRSPNDVYRSRAQYRAPLNLEVPTMWHRAVDNPTSSNSSTEMLLNPRPQRTQHTRQRHPKQATLRGHGAKREKSRKEMRQQPSSGWSLFGPSTSSPPRTPRRRDRDREHYKTIDATTSPRSHRSSRSQRASTTATQYHAEPAVASSSSSQASPPRSQHQRSHRSRTSTTHSSSQRPSTSSRSRPAAPQNTSARRVPDRRFAVLAATNTALEDLRREAFAQATPPPPPRRERLRRYQGVTLPAASIPYSWDCVSSSRESAAGVGGVGGGESSRRGRRGR